MKTFTYDFHIHTCLSPCGDRDMTPYNILHFAQVVGLEIIGITDHNTAGNCKPAMELGKRLGITVIPGMELSTAEDIHMTCLFPNLAKAEAFGELVYSLLPPIQNKPDIYGEQLYCDTGGGILATEPRLLSNATSILGHKAVELVLEYGGVCYPSHIDRQANSVLSILGGIDSSMKFTHVELNRRESWKMLTEKHPLLLKKTPLLASDAHWLTAMVQEPFPTIELKDASIESVFSGLRK